MDRKKELQKKLTDKQRMFCSEYILDWNSARAAIAAGYSENTARQTAYEILTKPYIQEYIELIKNDIEGELGITKAGMMKILKKLATSNIADTHKDWMTQEDFEKLKKDKPDILEAIQEISTKTETIKDKYSDPKDPEYNDVKYVKIKLYDKRLAIQDLIKAMGYNEPDRIEVKPVLDTSSMTTEELIRRARAIEKIKKEKG